MKFDYLIIGAGFSGLVFAERMANVLGRSCLVVEKRPHIGGNSYDEYDAAGILIHKYGPHYFRTNSDRVREYLTRFTDWLPVQYKVLSWTDGQYWSFPVNLKTFEQLQGRVCTEEEFVKYLAEKRVPIDNPNNSEEAVVAKVGWEIYEKFFKNYTQKQWGRPPCDLDASVCGRIPIRTNRDDRYLRENFQALPKAGYARMFEKMITCNSKIHVLLNADYRDIRNYVQYNKIVCTGPIDEYFDYRLGHLPYRSLRFERTTYSAAELEQRFFVSGQRGFWQPSLQVNYPNDFGYTRTVEMKHATQQQSEVSTVVREYPLEYSSGQEPYYPIPNATTDRLLADYCKYAEKNGNGTLFLGRLAEYKYYNMDQVVENALRAADAEIERCKAGSTRY